MLREDIYKKIALLFRVQEVKKVKYFNLDLIV